MDLEKEKVLTSSHPEAVDICISKVLLKIHYVLVSWSLQSRLIPAQSLHVCI